MERDPRYREDLRERAKELYRSGHSTTEVAEKMDLSRTRIVQLLHEAGVQLRPRGRPRKRRQTPRRAA